ncbi:MAG: cation-translocating P-type ATPase [Candidatus Bathyarchaeota archaeon]|nr:cation-translocating P-type ATPase [Candidatus Bathyarchaeota archaeon]
MNKMSDHSKDESESFEEEEGRGVWLKIAVALGITIVIAGFLDLFFQGIPLNFIIPILNEPASVSIIMLHTSVIAAGAYIGFKGLKELVLERRFSIEFLMAVAALGAAYLDFLYEGAMVLFLYSLAEYFEDYIADRARKTVETLSKFMPDKANVLVNGTENSLGTKEIQLGMIILVRPGERIALDGTITEGTSSIDQSLVTGESVPISKKTGDNVYAGTLNLNGVLKVAVTKKAENTLVSRIVELVMESRKRKASIEKLVDKFARIYVPLVVLLAALTAVLGSSFGGGTPSEWVYRSLILLVISCPSAFVISVPATIFTAVTIAARKGAIIKGGVYVEKLARIKAVVFDKTGTLTFGRPIVHELKSNETIDSKVLTYAAALEQFSDHPIAKAIVSKAKEQKLSFDKLEVNDIEEISGRGIIGRVNGSEVIIGNIDLVRDYGCSCGKIVEFYENETHTGICIAIEKVGEASVCLMDTVRNDAMSTINQLKKDEIHTVMLTGDKREIAEDAAKELGIDKVHAELLPEDKLRLLNEIRAEKGSVAMVGDGVNDAPALAASDVGIAMGGSGVDVALESADVVLVKDELVQIPYLLRLSGKTMRIAKENIAASLAIKIALGTLGLMGLIPLWFTVAAGDDGVTMLVLLNTLRLSRMKL